ncbi:phase 1 flagellin transcriptional repressor [Salmonella enterica subsp. enterica serovar Newport]|nr:phase 1 flagellin transcriptional repressor [Salmonella enterica subsp. enterica serovar Newport]
MNDISYGRVAEIWPRKYTMLIRRILYLRFHSILVRLINAEGITIIGYISKFDAYGNVIQMSDTPRGNVRHPIFIKNIALLEEITGALKSNMDHCHLFNLVIIEPSKKDFFSICNKCYKQNSPIRVFLKSGLTVEGRTTGVNDCHVGVVNQHGNHLQIMFDWVNRITSIDYKS